MAMIDMYIDEAKCPPTAGEENAGSAEPYPSDMGTKLHMTAFERAVAALEEEEERKRRIRDMDRF